MPSQQIQPCLLFWHGSCYVKGKENKKKQTNNNTEDIMSANTITRTETKTDVGYEASRFGLNVGMAMAALIGLWGAACLIGGLAGNGIGGMLKGLMTAITGF